MPNRHTHTYIVQVENLGYPILETLAVCGPVASWTRSSATNPTVSGSSLIPGTVFTFFSHEKKQQKKTPTKHGNAMLYHYTQPQPKSVTSIS